MCHDLLYKLEMFSKPFMYLLIKFPGDWSRLKSLMFFSFICKKLNILPNIWASSEVYCTTFYISFMNITDITHFVSTKFLIKLYRKTFIYNIIIQNKRAIITWYNRFSMFVPMYAYIKKLHNGF